jgi:hypothetical protein
MRFDTDLLAKAKRQAVRENRTLTNFIETVVRQRVTDAVPVMGTANACAAEPSPMLPSVSRRND